MRILVTGAEGFVGKNLVRSLLNVQNGLDCTRGVTVEAVYAYDLNTDPDALEDYCARCDFVFHLAGVNRPKNAEDFMLGNFGFSSTLLDTLQRVNNRCPVMLASSVQASLVGRYADGEYGKSKKAGEELFFAYGRQTGAKVLVYRFPNLFGKWCRPNYNSAVATFCHNMAHELPITVNDPTTELELLYIDDLIDEMFCALRGEEHRCEFDGVTAVSTRDGSFCVAPETHRVTLGQIVTLLEQFWDQPRSLTLPEMPAGSFTAKLYATYLSYLPKEKLLITPLTHTDQRGSFTELLKTHGCGQFSVNITKPGVTKGQHWHHTKWEFFAVVSGHGMIRLRRVDADEVLEFTVSGEVLQMVHMLPGYAHSITNLSETEPLVTLMWASECFDAQRPDTYYEPV